jgi:hypothetical protein
MHRVSLTVMVISVPLILLAATVAISSTVLEDVFAREGGRYSGGGSDSQAASVSNECLNPILDSNTIDNMVSVGNCGGTVSQQDESGQAGATTTHQTANPTIELQRSTTGGGLGSPQNVSCEGCLSGVESIAEEFFGTSIADACAMLATLDQAERNSKLLELRNFLEDSGEIADSAIMFIFLCLQNAFSGL